MAVSNTHDRGSLGDRLADGELLETWVLDHQRSALEQLVERYTPLVLGVCRRQCRNQHDVEDAFQATFLLLARDADRIRNPHALPGWLHQAAYRIACRARRRELDRPESLTEDPPDATNPLDQVARRHELRILDEEIAGLPETYRQTLVLHLLEGHSHAQVAFLLGTTLGTIRGRLQRGKSELRKRLRQRGVVPGAVISALALWPPNPAAAAELATRFVTDTLAGTPADSIVELPKPSSLQPLLETGSSSVMTATSLLTGCAAAAAMLIVLSAHPYSAADRPLAEVTRMPSASAPDSLALIAPIEPAPAPIEQLATLPQTAGSLGSQANEDSTDAANERPALAPENVTAQLGDMGMGGGAGIAGGGAGNAVTGGGGMGGAMGGMGGTTITKHYHKREPQSAVAVATRAALDEAVTLPLGTVTLTELRDLVFEAAEVPVLLDDRGLKAAEVSGSDPVTIERSGLPLRTVLREILRPLGVKAIVEEDGLLLTADLAALARQGKQTTQWVNIPNEAAEQIERQLDELVSVEMAQQPLLAALKQLGAQKDVPLHLNRRALEEIGLTEDVPVSLQLSEVPLRTALQLLLEDLDLTYVNRGALLSVTTFEDAESTLLTRIYWLDGTGTPDLAAIMQQIQTAMKPDTWEALGGRSTMVPMVTHHRNALMITTTSPVHHDIQSFLDALRANHFGDEGEYDVSETHVPNMGGMGGGMGGMGAGGMGGGMVPGGMF